MHRATLLLLVLISPFVLANEPYSEVRDYVYEALDTGNPEHPSWYEAAELLREPLTKDLPWAKFYAAFLFAYGAGGYPEDFDKADILENSAANDGFLPAMVSQARRYEHGLSGTVDLVIARSWYEKAALSGSRSAAERLERAYTLGELNLERDSKEAERWEKVKGECKSP